jgi:H+-translocating diphosphatase
MGADLFGSFAESTCAALVISAVSDLGTSHDYVAMSFPLVISALGILVCLFTTLIATDFKPATQISEIELTLKIQLVVSTIIMTPVRGLPVAAGKSHLHMNGAFACILSVAMTSLVGCR